MEPLLPHNLSHNLRHFAERLVETTTIVLEGLGTAAERAAKEHVREGGAHRAGTRTPASHGRGPAVITGDLSRAVSHELDGLTVRIGAMDVPHRPAKPNWKPPRATAGQIGGYVEEKGFPWLVPAVEEVMAAAELDGVIGPRLDEAFLNG